MNSVKEGVSVLSSFEFVSGPMLSPAKFDEPHIGIAATFNGHGDIGRNLSIAYFWTALGAPREAIWQPGSRMRGTNLILSIVALAIQRYTEHSMLPKGAKHNLFGEVLSFSNELTPIEASDHTEYTEYDDRKPHVDFVPSEQPCAMFIGASNGGTLAWEGAFTYRGNNVPSYAAATQSMAVTETRAGDYLFTPDARTFVHARAGQIENAERTLIRLYLGA